MAPSNGKSYPRFDTTHHPLHSSTLFAANLPPQLFMFHAHLTPVLRLHHQLPTSPLAMPPKRKLEETDIHTPPAVPPSLPPSVEEAYRRKCVQLKNRTIEVEDANDAARLRLTRVKRQVEKLRIERAFLLEQLAKRTSTNVEDSEGSPSPPPTVCAYPNPLSPRHC